MRKVSTPDLLIARLKSMVFVYTTLREAGRTGKQSCSFTAIHKPGTGGGR
ncbi:hypothetical protein [Scytonema sp. NUACC26]